MGTQKHEIRIRGGDFMEPAWLAPGEGLSLHDKAGKPLRLIPFTDVKESRYDPVAGRFTVRFRDGRLLIGTADEATCVAVANIAPPLVQSEPAMPPERTEDGDSVDN